MKLTKHQKVTAALTDTKANLSVMGIFQIVEEAITELMGELKLDDIISKKKYNAIWVFTKSKIEIHKDIAWNKEYTCISFISKITPISICIDIGIKNDSDELCMYSRANLCALDLHSGKHP